MLPDPRPPPRPPRLASAGSSSKASASFPSPYSAPENVVLSSTDPRTSPTQSLVPSIAEPETRRRLLVVYIHGFYGNDQSFRSFPAHVHALLKILLSSSHVIHSKIYPRYKTYKPIEIARDKFSAWLEPHESPSTDVILVGHSMGGLLAADVVLMSNRSSSRPQLLKHRILGIIAMDAPLLGLHPGIVMSGLASLFQPSPKVDAQQESPEASPELEFSHAIDSPSSSIDYLSSVNSTSGSIYTEPSTPSQSLRQPNDPYFDPPFHNDAPFREQSFLKRLMNFHAKHKSEGLLMALGTHIKSHLEFGSCLADYRGLHTRYNRLRALEDVEEIQHSSNGRPAGVHTRVRFVNYYTLCPGRLKLPRPGLARPEEPDANSLAARCVAQGGRECSQDSDDKARRNFVAVSAKAAHADAGVSDDKACIDEVSADIVSLAIESHDNMVLPNVASTDEGQADKDTTPSRLTNTKNGQLPDPTALYLTPMAIQLLEPQPLTDDDEKGHQSLPTTPPTPATQNPPPNLDLPAISEPPEPPILPDPSQFSDKDAKRQAEREAKRLQKAYDQAIKDRNKAIQERERLLQKKCKKALKEAEKKRQSEQKEKLRREKEEKMCVVAPVDGPSHGVSKVGEEAKKETEKEKERETNKAEEREEREEREEEKTKKKEEVKKETEREKEKEKKKEKKLKRFVILPSARNGVRDETWLDVYMEDKDEVGAHCGLFVPGPHYDKLVGDVGTRVAGWVEDDLRKRAGASP
ncbi:hypothetical protein E4U48_007045 [Claviceps purpurea]|nr:hypothetical protein E4U48_007045 [Claviceps purpurea]